MPSLDDLKKLGQQFVQAATVAGDKTYSAIPEFNNYAKASFLAPIIKSGVSGGSTLSSVRGQEADDEDKAAKDAQITKLQNEADGSKYTKQRKADGGFAFFDGNGNQVDISKYAQVTGQTRADVLKDSENPIDQQYVNDYNNLNDLRTAIYNGDKDTVSQFADQNPATKGLSVQALGQLLISKYPHIYGNGSYQQTFSNRNRNIFAENPNYVGSSGSSLSSLGL